MGGPNIKASEKVNQLEPSFGRFRRALRRADQIALDELVAMASPHLELAQYSPHALPMEILLLALVLEEHKEVLRLKIRVDTLMKRPSLLTLPGF
jgi:hypothetical protein